MQASLKKRHGGPWDRGSADKYYGRNPNPHFYIDATHQSPRVEKAEMTPEEIAAYMEGYNYQVETKEYE
jgi:hypothetical protein